MIKVVVSDVEEIHYEVREMDQDDDGFDFELSPEDYFEYSDLVEKFQDWQLKIEKLLREKKK